MNRPSKEKSPAEGKLVLLVDDDQDILEVYELILLKAGYRVEKALDGHAALGKMDSHLPDVVVLDLMMPNCSGFEVLLALQEKKGPKPPIIVVTGVYRDAETAQKVRSEPMVFDFLIKPIRHKKLLDTVRRALPPEMD